MIWNKENTASLAHELKTPLAVLSGWLDLPQPDRGEMPVATRRLISTVDVLLLALKCSSGDLVPKPEWNTPGRKIEFMRYAPGFNFISPSLLNQRSLSLRSVASREGRGDRRASRVE